jgi:hypothetical protein
MGFDRSVLQAILPTYQLLGVERVFAVNCCGRVYVGTTPAQRCRTCTRTPENHEVRTDGSNLDALTV